MSHITTISLRVQDLDALAIACSALGLELVRDQKTFHWYGAQPQQCEHVIRRPDATAKTKMGGYEIGVTRSACGTHYALKWDAFDRKLLEAVGGADCDALKQRYSVAVTQRQLQSQGYTINEQRQADGSVRLVCTQ
jgi:hypothetical protein